MSENNFDAKRLLLHACCGPCSLEPVRLLREQGYDMTIFYSNSNIHPRAEYNRRLSTLLEWAQAERIPVIEGVYDDAAWHNTVGIMQLAGGPRAERCRHCYHLRLEEAAAWAATHGFRALSTTLAVSPYQCFNECREELEWCCAEYGLEAVWQDFRPYYPKATQRSRDLGMYRQNYCGCVYSQAEAAEERAQAKAHREQEKAARAAEREKRELAETIARAKHAAEQAAYDRKQQAKRAARNAARDAARAAYKEHAHENE